MHNKPIYLIPFIIVYRFVFFILKIPMNVCKYFYLGFRTTLIVIFDLFISICVLFYQIPKYFFKGVKFLILIVLNLFNVKKKESKPNLAKTKVVDATNVLESKNKIDYNKLRKLKLQEQRRIQQNLNSMKQNNQKQEVKEKKKEKPVVTEKKNDKDIYINKNVDIKKPTLSEQFDSLLNSFKKIPSKIKNRFRNNDFIKHSRNKDLMKKEALLINFDGDDAEKSDKKVLYEYVAKTPEGRVVKDYFEAFSKVEVHSFLLSEGLEVYSIKTNKWIQLMHKKANLNNTKIKTKDLIFFITQLSTYIKAGIPLVESLRILERQYKNKNYKKIFKAVIYDLTMGDNFSDALLKQNVAFPKLFINMVKTAEMTGELPEVLDDMAEYYTEVDSTRKQMITAMMYPSIVFVFAIGVMIFIMMFVVPQFVEIYESMDASKIPAFTLAVIAVSDFLKHNIVWVLLGVLIFVILFIYLYKNIKMFRTVCQWIVMKLPIFGNTVIYNEVTMFTKTFSSLLSHNVFITESMEVLNKITNNEIYKMLILDTITNLAKGDKISEAFKDHWAFPVPAYEMLVTGEKTGELPEMMAKVSTYYQELHKNSVTRIKTFIEPALTVFLTVMVGTIILAIIIPMFGMYSSIQGT